MELDHRGLMNTLFNKDITSIKDLTLAEINLILETAITFKKNPIQKLLADKIIAHCFFEPSTRTRLSFETATLRLGGQVIGFSDADNTSIKKGESLHDSIKVIENYADLIVLRHPQEGAARLAADISSKPIINAGDGSNQHPTQALVDLFSIKETQREVNGLHIALMGDLKYGRTIHSFVQICAQFDIRFYIIAPESLTLSSQMTDVLKARGIKFSFHPTIEEVISKIDVLYMTRLQQERFNKNEFFLLKEPFVLTPNMLAQAKANLKIMHPLPRTHEISTEVDQMPYAFYFQQAANGLPVRQALLTLLLNEEK